MVAAVEAYPRASGATRHVPASPFSGGGLSPSERGDLTSQIRVAKIPRPIPERAGRPGRRSHQTIRARAYPRASVATAFDQWPMTAEEGLSPSERGDLVGCEENKTTIGPIPERAGRPATGRANVRQPGAYPERAGRPPGTRHGSGQRGAYPRASGATLSELPIQFPPRGLSPSERGDPLEHRPKPARKGGLSPSERGDHAKISHRQDQRRPIPERAGRPAAVCR